MRLRLLAALRYRPGRSAEQDGQALPLFMLMIFVIVGSIAVVTDVSWFWVNQQKMQRAADAGALAGAVFLPGDVPGAYAAARAAAIENGFTNGSGGVVVTPQQDLSNRRRLGVTVRGPVNTFFARVFGFNQTSVASVSRAEYTLPVPMGSPQNYYGVGYYVGPTTTNNTTFPTGNYRHDETTTPAGTWLTPTNAATINSQYATASTNDQVQQWSGFGMQGSVPNGPALVVEGIQIRLQNVFLQGSGTSLNCQLRGELSWDGGTSWSTAQTTNNVSTTNTDDRDIGSSTVMTAWGAHVWTWAQLSDANLRVRLTWLDSTINCASTRSIAVDDVDLQVYYHTTLVTPTTTWGVAPVLSPTGGTLAPQNFWAAMQSQGAPSAQGDAYMTKWAPRKTANAAYDYASYYNYGVDVPAGASNGQIWIFDPGFCDTGTDYGLGENWTISSPNGFATKQYVSSYYEVWDTAGTPYDVTDDVRKDVTSDDALYRQLKVYDARTAGQPGSSANTSNAGATPVTDCSALPWHFGWIQIAGNLPGNATYRLHTYSTDKTALSDQDDTTALNAFAVWSTATGGTPRVYGSGAMEAYMKLPQNQVSEFYLAQIEAAHAGKTLVIELWDPGDTGNLSANLQILAPNSTNYAATNFSWSATSTFGGACNGTTSPGVVTTVTTNTGGTSLYNGCWLTITIPLPATYTAPHPSSDSVTAEAGWWKIRYTMGSGSGSATDLTTWKVSIRGSPVHLVP